MPARFSSEELYGLRNQVPIRRLIEELKIPGKEVEGVFRFLCPDCGEFQTAINARTNLSRCFLCQKNFNTIELAMADQGLSFVESVKLLKRLFGSSIPVHRPPGTSAILNIS